MTIRRAFAWLLLALLPLQGVAGAAMSGCPGHHGDAHAGATAAANDVAAGLAGAAHCEEAAGTHDCERCSGCCLAGALGLPAAGFAIGRETASAAIAFAPVVASPWVARPLERPPR